MVENVALEIRTKTQAKGTTTKTSVDVNFWAPLTLQLPDVGSPFERSEAECSHRLVLFSRTDGDSST